MAEKTTAPKLVTVVCLDPEEPNPTLHIDVKPITFVDGKAEMPDFLADVLIKDRGNVYKDDNGKYRPKFKLA